ncbi:alpha/beta hydrolase [Pseudomonas lundensis]|uniref:alpha/beta fold hydrolase n=1 Tax=Serratia proteamaculans TaxID=28151 RepID=UPI002981A1F7|nr:alpha/beta hydrolase [Serratia proteamaculans]MDW5499276.1 alpha/beta hydrolase [Serratia proteamaculans]MDW5504338.1 alpha/beta hydrolase [Pseudomonas lundensis]
MATTPHPDKQIMGGNQPRRAEQSPLLNARVIGQGTRAVVMLQGWFGDHSVYQPMFPYLDTETFTYVFVDFRGYGKSRDIPGSYTTTEMVEDVIALMDKLGWQRFDVVGHSMGGKIAQIIAARSPDRVRSAVGVTPVPASGLDAEPQVWPVFELSFTDDTQRHSLIDFSTNHRLPHRWVSDIVQQSRAACDPQVFEAYFQSWAKDDCSAETYNCTVPLLLLIGEHDPALTLPIMDSTCVEWFVNVQVELLEGCGHYPMQETPVYLVGAIERFLSKQN